MTFNFEFILGNDRGRLPSRLFFSSMYKLGIDIEKYLLPPNCELEPKDMVLYCDAIKYDLLLYVKSGGEKDADYNYVSDIVGLLRDWSKRGHTIKVL